MPSVRDKAIFNTTDAENNISIEEVSHEGMMNYHVFGEGEVPYFHEFIKVTDKQLRT